MRMCTNLLAENLKPWKMAMESPNTSISEDVCAIILRSIKEKQKGGEGLYRSVVDNLASCVEEDAAGQLLWVRSLQACVHVLTKEEDLLVGTALRMPWRRNSQVVVEYIHFIKSLVAIQTFYVQPCLQMLVRLFAARPDVSTEEQRAVHLCLKEILVAMPTAPRFLVQQLAANMPYKGRQAAVLELHLRSLLHVSDYQPRLQREVLRLAVEELVQLDVELPRLSLEPPTAAHAGVEVEGGILPFELDMDDVPLPDGDERAPLPVSGGCPVLQVEYAGRSGMVNETADKMDSLMLVFFEHLWRATHREGDLDMEQASRVFGDMLQVFEEVVLVTHGSTHVQFLLFYLCSLNSEFAKSFLDSLWEQFANPNTPTVTRISCVAYMANFVARAQFVSLRIAQECLSVLTQWVHQYIDSVSEDQLKPDIHCHAPFYSACQAVFYLVIFRHRQLTAVPSGIDFLKKLHLDRVISTRLNPLKLCLPTVVEKFAQITKQLEVVFCYSLIERNKRLVLQAPEVSSLPEAQKLQSHLSVSSLLDCFFPFDPYCLARSGRFVYPLYTNWEEEEEEEGEEGEVEGVESRRHSSTDLEENSNHSLSSPVLHGSMTTDY